MKKFNFLPLVSLGLMSISLLGCASTQYHEQVFEEDKLQGEWLCKVSESDSGMTLDVEIEVNYQADGQAITDMTIRTYLPDELQAETDLPNPLKVVHRITSTYTFNGTYIEEVETGNELIYSNLPEDGELDDLFDPEDFRSNSDSSTQVTSLNDSELGLATDDGELLCQRTN